MTNKARRILTYFNINGMDVTSFINKHLQSLSYTDNLKDNADDLQIVLSNISSVLQDKLLFNIVKSASITANVSYFNKFSDNGNTNVNLGFFIIDTIAFSQNAITIKASSKPPISLNEIVSKSFENITLSEIVKNISTKHNLDFRYLTEYDPFYKSKEQTETDISFISSLCTSAGLCLKITLNSIVIFEALTYEKSPSIKTIKFNDENIIDFSFNTTYKDTHYKDCEIKYTDSLKKETVKFKYTPPNPYQDGVTLHLTTKADDLKEAFHLAKSKLREKNKKEISGQFTLIGDFTFLASTTIDILGFSIFDGKYIIESAVHSFTGGYSTKIKITECLEGY